MSTTPQALIQKAREVSEAATPGLCDVVGPTNPAKGIPMYVVITSRGPLAEFVTLADAQLFATARTLLPEIANKLAGQVARAGTLERELVKLEHELTKLKSSMVDALADAYDKGCRTHEDDRTSEHD